MRLFSSFIVLGLINIKFNIFFYFSHLKEYFGRRREKENNRVFNARVGKCKILIKWDIINLGRREHLILKHKFKKLKHLILRNGGNIVFGSALFVEQCIP